VVYTRGGHGLGQEGPYLPEKKKKNGPIRKRIHLKKQEGGYTKKKMTERPSNLAKGAAPQNLGWNKGVVVDVQEKGHIASG